MRNYHKKGKINEIKHKNKTKKTYIRRTNRSNIQKAKIHKDENGVICVYYNGFKIPTRMKSLF